VTAKRKDPLLHAPGFASAAAGGKKWTQEGLTERSGLDQSYVAGIEAGTAEPVDQSPRQDRARAWDDSLSLVRLGRANLR
jgi:hypothetical protein